MVALRSGPREIFRMKSLTAALLATAMLVTPVMASEIDATEPTTPGFKLLRSEELLTENVEPMPSPVVKLGDMEIQLEKTTLIDLAAKFGGDIATSNKENAGISWLCYTTPATGTAPASLTWFASDGIMGMNYSINFIVTEVVPAGDTPTCIAPTASLNMTSDLPGPGSPVADVTAKLAGLDPTQDGTLSYGGEAPLPAYLDFPGASTGRTINFAIAGGVVTATTLSQVSTN